MTSAEEEAENLEVARRWCATRGRPWTVVDQAGRGGTAPVFTVDSPDGPRALKIYDTSFSQGERGEESERRLKPQLDLGVHDCPHIVKIYEGGRFEDRLFLLMSKAPGQELEKRLQDIPRAKIRSIVGQAARACIYLRERNLCHRDLKSANVFVADDFEHVTLLDLSVTRDIYDPVGVGTDHGGQLPVVATSRYSPPDYLFRLVDPGPALWHALDIYQLGGLLHDLIMREPMFNTEYQLSRENRYRFAWIVATQGPTIEAADVDSDLLWLARRALDKDWIRRGTLQLEDFLDDQGSRRLLAREALGLSSARKVNPQAHAVGNLRRRIGEVAPLVERGIKERLKRSGVTATHQTVPGQTDGEKVVVLGWNAAHLQLEEVLQDVELRASMGMEERSGFDAFVATLELTASVDGKRRTTRLDIPAVPDDANAADVLAGGIFEALADLASGLMRNQDSVGE